MPAITMAVEHGRDPADARAVLRSAVDQTVARFGPLVRHVAWSTAGDAVRVTGAGFAVDLAADATHVRVSGELTGAAGMIAGPVVAGLKQIVRRAVQSRLPGGKP